MTDTIATTSREAILVDHYTDTDPTALTVSFAFVAVTGAVVEAPAIAEDVWTEGEWGTTALQTTGAHRGRYLTVARIVIGPGSDVDTLDPGRYRVFTWVDGVTTDPVKRSGDIIITA